MIFSVNGIEVNTNAFEKAIKSKKAKIESHANYPVQATIENSFKKDYRLMLETSCKEIIKHLTNKL